MLNSGVLDLACPFLGTARQPSFIFRLSYCTCRGCHMLCPCIFREVEKGGLSLLEYVPILLMCYCKRHVPRRMGRDRWEAKILGATKKTKKRRRRGVPEPTRTPRYPQSLNAEICPEFHTIYFIAPSMRYGFDAAGIGQRPVLRGFELDKGEGDIPIFDSLQRWPQGRFRETFLVGRSYAAFNSRFTAGKEHARHALGFQNLAVAHRH
ncbi:hypothetical protein B0H63DRAFT_222611 [Podospora didyma]|uniref:Uncharacterized protein n=1 Tax=Podospora didyma TaxID=330526 RepID=A0AAE0NBK6_9PEZI|nr:hypothetical protein B0H63DRAFT_222611 [Podospora didyma]